MKKITKLRLAGQLQWLKENYSESWGCLDLSKDESKLDSNKDGEGVLRWAIIADLKENKLIPKHVSFKNVRIYPLIQQVRDRALDIMKEIGD